MDGTCSRVFRLPQMYGTCWMNSLLMSMFYSQGMRNLLLGHMNQWGELLIKANPDVKMKLQLLYVLIKDIMVNKFIEVPDRVVDDVAANLMVPTDFMTLLNQLDPKKFFYTDPNKGGWGFVYIKDFLRFLGVEKVAFIDIFLDDKNAFVAKAFVSSHLIRNYKSTHTTPRKQSVSTIFDIESAKKNNLYRAYAKYTNKENNYELLVLFQNQDSYFEDKENAIYSLGKFNLNKTFTFNGQKYIVDAIHLHNFNRKLCSRYHSIAGITCNNSRYIYNGWLALTQDKAKKEGISDNNRIPCPLFKYDWLNNKGHFCIKSGDCKLGEVGVREEKEELCFNTFKHLTVYFAVREDIYMRGLWYEKCNNRFCELPKPLHKTKTAQGEDNIKEKTLPEQKTTSKKGYAKDIENVPERLLNGCPEGKIMNPKTGRCIKDPALNKTKSTKVVQVSKECPDGKVINPKTGRCIKDPSMKRSKVSKAIQAECRDGKVINPKTGRCIKDPSMKKVKTAFNDIKQCPVGKVLNPKTGRCIIDRSIPN